jgi:hypothetical protein
VNGLAVSRFLVPFEWNLRFEKKKKKKKKKKNIFLIIGVESVDLWSVGRPSVGHSKVTGPWPVCEPSEEF